MDLETPTPGSFLQGLNSIKALLVEWMTFQRPAEERLLEIRGGWGGGGGGGLSKQIILDPYPYWIWIMINPYTLTLQRPSCDHLLNISTLTNMIVSCQSLQLKYCMHAMQYWKYSGLSSC